MTLWERVAVFSVSIGTLFGLNKRSYEEIDDMGTDGG